LSQEERRVPLLRCTVLHGREGLYGRGVNINPRDFKKVAPYLGILLLIAAVVFTLERFLM
jgi:hypothetical protein